VVALATGLVIAAILLVVHAGPTAQGFTPRRLAAVLVFGVFIGVVYVTEAGSPGAGKSIRTAAGAVAGTATALLLELPWEGAVLVALLGPLLGYLGSKWAAHVQWTAWPNLPVKPGGEGPSPTRRFH
jgi:hypothetical protein